MGQDFLDRQYISQDAQLLVTALCKHKLQCIYSPIYLWMPSSLLLLCVSINFNVSTLLYIYGCPAPCYSSV